MADGPRQEPSAMEDLESRISLLESEVGRTAIWKFILDFVEGDQDKERAVQRLRTSVLGGTHGNQREQNDTLDNRLKALETDLSDVRLFLASQVPDLRTLQSVWVRAVANGEYLADKIIEVEQLAGTLTGMVEHVAKLSGGSATSGVSGLRAHRAPG